MKKIFVGLMCIVFVSACTNNDTPDEAVEKDKLVLGIAAPKKINFNVLGIYPHDTSAYTQGLEIYNGKMYESTGDFAASSLRITNAKTGKVDYKHMMGTDKIFGEGITIFNGQIYQLTWKNNFINVYDINKPDKPFKTIVWPYEGWGITHTNSELIISDGTANLYFINPSDFKLKRTVQVVSNTGAISMLNELEYIEGYIYANVYGKDFIAKINPENGHVVGWIDLTGLLKEYARDYVLQNDNEVLNGIAWDSTSKKLYITGKHWPKMFEGTLNE